MASARAYPPIGDYALIGDCQAAALVSRECSIDWCCLPRIDDGSCFARLLDWEGGGSCRIEAPRGATFSRRYLDGTLVLETTIAADTGTVRVLDLLTINASDPAQPYHEILRVIEGVRGVVDLGLHIVARFDYGAARPWRRFAGERTHTLIAGDDGLIVHSDAELEPDGEHDLAARITVRAEHRVRLSLRHAAAHLVAERASDVPSPAQLDDRLDETVDWWRRWTAGGRLDAAEGPAAMQSAIVLKALANSATGAIAAAATTSLPERPGGSMNWDYRFSWIRDSVFSSRALSAVGFDAEADAFRRFVERSSAGSAEDLQIMFGVGGERRLTEITIDDLEGYRGAAPVRSGNAASGQLQLDVFGELLELTWRWHQRGHSPDDDFWRFIVELVDTAVEKWEMPDKGLWEVRGDPEHFVHSKVMCWAALDRGLRLAEECMRRAPVTRWRRARDAVRAAVDERGYDAERGIYVRAFGSDQLDAALLLLPTVDFVAWDDERMVRTADAVRAELDDDGLLKRYLRPSDEAEGAFLACSFWLAECYVRQGRDAEARTVYDRAMATGNDLGLFSEEFDTARGEALGNFPQGLTHLSQISAALAFAERAQALG